MLATTWLVAGGVPAFAVDAVWVGTTSSWDTATNWSPDPSTNGGGNGPTVFDTATFSNNGAVTAVTSTQNVQPFTVTYSAGAPTYTLTLAEDMSVNGAIFNNSGTTQNIIINGNKNLFISGGATANMSVTLLGNAQIGYYGTADAANVAITMMSDRVVDGRASLAPLVIGSLQGSGTFYFQSGGVGFDTKTVQIGGLNTSTTFEGAFADSGAVASIEKVGTGTLTLSPGNQLYFGSTTVSAGTLVVNGTLLFTSGVTVSPGATLGGTGTVRNTSIIGGKFRPGDGTAASSMAVTGTLGFDAASTYAINVNPATASKAVVSGAATPGGATVSATFAAGSYISKKYTILTAASINGTFGALTNTNLPANFTDTLSYDATHAYLNLTLNFTPTSPAGPNFGSGLDNNQQHVANTLVNYFNATGGIPAVFGTLTPAGLTQVSGEAGAGSIQPSFGASDMFLGLLSESRTEGGEGGAIGFAGGALGYAAAKKPATDAFAALDRRTPAFRSRWNVWASGYGGNSTVSGNSTTGSHTAGNRVYGTAVGADYRVAPDTLLGFALGGAGFNYNLDSGLGGGRADLFQAGAYARHNVGPAYVSGALAYSWQDIATDRTVALSGDKLHAGFHANTFAARTEAGYRYATAFAGVAPYAALQATSFLLPSYSETATSGGNTFALSYASKTTTNLRSELGGRADKSFLVRDGVFTLRARAAWAHDSNTDRPVTAAFQTLPGTAFTVNGAASSANAALVTAGVEMKWRNGITLAGSFDGEFSNTTRSYAGKGTVKYAW